MRVEALVDLGVDPADEERRDAADAGEVAAGRGERFEPADVRLDDLGVAVQREDEGDVDAATLGDHRSDRRYAFGGGGDLDEQVRERDALMQITGRGDGRVGVARELGGYLDRDEAVHSI